MFNLCETGLTDLFFKDCLFTHAACQIFLCLWSRKVAFSTYILNYFCPVSTIQYGQCWDKGWKGGQETDWISRATLSCISTTCSPERILMNNICFEMLLVPLLYCFPMNSWIKVQCNSWIISALFSSRSSQNS